MQGFFAHLGQLATQAVPENPTDASQTDLGRTLGGLGQMFGQGLDQAFSEAEPRNAPTEQPLEDGQEGNASQSFGALGQFLGQSLARAAARNGFEQDLNEALAGVMEELTAVTTQASGPPPASISSLGSLPKVTISTTDIEANQSTSCAICLEDFAIGEEATRVPCGHLYHDACVKKWLGMHNQCPVCRYELPTDNTFYEPGRKARMAERKIRLHMSELSAKSLAELRHLAEHWDVNIEGCLEKQELVDRIAASPHVEILEPRDSGDSLRAAKSAFDLAPGNASSLGRFGTMRMAELKAEMRRLGIDARDCIEKDDLIKRLVLAGAAPAAAD